MEFREDVVKGLRERFPSIHPLIFHRSMEKSTSPGQLFDILQNLSDDITSKGELIYPLIWKDKGWATTDDLFQANGFFGKI